MKIYDAGADKYIDRPPFWVRIRGLSVALGSFDGIHVGHRTLIDETFDAAVHRNGRSAVFVVIDDRPDAPPLIYPLERTLIELSIDVDYVISAKLGEICDMSPEEFVALLKRLGSATLVCGYNFRFGRGRAGDTTALEKMFSGFRRKTVVVPKVEIGGAAVSASRIRAAIADGDMAQASVLLGGNYTIEGTVIHGSGLGHKLGTPTANIPLPDGCVAPKFGVYASIVYCGEDSYPAVTNIGVKPTFGGVYAPLVESYIPDDEPNLYGKTVRVALLKFIREERRFETPQALQARIKEDVEAARAAHDRFDMTGG